MAGGATRILDRRALNRATLARQMLLERAPLAPRAAVAHLVGLQAQEPRDPYVGLWSRLRGFDPREVERLFLARELVRIVVMRGTIHLVTAEDALTLRPLTQPVMDAEIALHSEYAPMVRDVDLGPVVAAGREILREPRSMPELRAALAERFPGPSPAALAYACRCLLPLVQVPPRGLWTRSARVTVATAESWLGRPVDADPFIDAVILRYLAALGPATATDAAVWSGLGGMGEVLERLRPSLVTFRDERGRELFDLPGAPRPGPDVPAPVRFLPRHDNLLLSHADRRRVADDRVRRALALAVATGGGSVLLDGFLAAAWSVERERDGRPAAIVVRHPGRLTKRAASSIAAEGRRLLRMTHPDAGAREVRFAPV